MSPQQRERWRTRRSGRGLALIIVLGLVIFLSVVALGFSDSLRLSTALSGNAIGIARAQAVADGAVHRMLVELQRPSQPQNPDNPAWRASGRTYRWVDNGIKVEVSARNEAAKIDLNFAAEPLLKQLFVSAGASDEAAVAIVAAIKDWSDADSLTRPNGAEADEYRAAGRKALPSNELFVSVEELKNVLGVTPSLYNAVAPRLTVHSRSAGIDPQSAPPEIFAVVPNLEQAQVSAWVAERDAAIAEDLPIPPMPFSSPYFSAGRTGSLRIVARATTADGISAAREASVREGTVRRGAPQFFLWQRPPVGGARSVTEEPPRE